MSKKNKEEQMPTATATEQPQFQDTELDAAKKSFDEAYQILGKSIEDVPMSLRSGWAILVHGAKETEQKAYKKAKEQLVGKRLVGVFTTKSDESFVQQFEEMGGVAVHLGWVEDFGINAISATGPTGLMRQSCLDGTSNMMENHMMLSGFRLPHYSERRFPEIPDVPISNEEICAKAYAFATMNGAAYFVDFVEQRIVRKVLKQKETGKHVPVLVVTPKGFDNTIFSSLFAHSKEISPQQLGEPTEENIKKVWSKHV